LFLPRKEKDIMTSTNKILSIPAKGQVEILDRPMPKITHGFALVKVIIAPICDEVRIYRDHAIDLYERVDLIGHESVGEIVEVRPGSKFKVGDRVMVFHNFPCGDCWVCRNTGGMEHCQKRQFGAELQEFLGNDSGGAGFSQYRTPPETQMYKIPDDMSYEHAAASLCLLGTIFSPMLEIGVDATDIVMVTGIGFVGLGGIVSAKYLGARVIAAVRNPYRKQLALDVGADWIIDREDPNVLDKIREISGNRGGVDIVIECSGYAAYRRLAIDGARLYGHVRFLGYFPLDEETFPLHIEHDLLDKHLTLSGSHDHQKEHRDQITEMISRVGDKIDMMVTHKFPMSRAKEAFETILTRECGKVYLYPHE
jgi:threonine dehydrogenase-like Zn-dependent dehydrogenase